MKEKIVITLILFGLIIFMFWGYIIWQSNQLPNNEIHKYLGIDEYTILKKIQVDHQLYVRIRIKKSDGEKIFNLYKDSLQPSNIPSNKFVNAFIKYDNSKMYYFNNQVNQMYGYIVISVSKSKELVELYESFGD